MLDLWSVYNVAFYFGSIILTAALLFLAWKSTFVPGQQNITVVVWQHPSGRQILQRFGASRGNNNPDHHNEQYEQIAFRSTGVGDIGEVESEEDLSIGRIIDIVQEAVQATSVALQDAQGSNILPSSLPISDTGNPSTSQGRPSVMEPTATPQLGPLPRDDSSSSSNLEASNQPTAASLSDSTTVQSVKPKSSTALNKVAIDNSDSTLNDVSSTDSSLTSSKQLGAAGTSGSSCMEKSNERSVSEVIASGTQVEEVSSCNISCGVEEVVQENQTTFQESPVSSTSKNSEISEYSSNGDEASKPLLQESTVPSSTDNKDESAGEASSLQEAPSNTAPEVTKSCPAPGTGLIEGSIRIRLKFLDDQQKTVKGFLTENVLCFKRKHFETELSEYRVVRLIFNGRLLKQEDSTLAEYGLYDNCVVHCHVSLPKPPPAVPPATTAVPGPAAGRQGGAIGRLLHMFRNVAAPDALDPDDPAEEGLNISNYLSGLLWLVVAGLWVARLKHSYMFSSFSTFMLVFLTLLLVVPHYLFSVDVQHDLSLDTRTLRNLGIERVVVLQRHQPEGEQQPPQQEGVQQGAPQQGSTAQQAEATSPQQSSQASSGISSQPVANSADDNFSIEPDAGSASTVSPGDSSAAASDASDDRPPVSPLEAGGGARRRNVV